MLKLLKLFIGLCGFALFAWLGATVPLGDRTLFGHISAIGQSKESQELVRGTKEKVEDLRKRIGTHDGSEKSADKGKAEGNKAEGATKTEGAAGAKVAGKGAGTVAGKVGSEGASGKEAHAPAGPPQDRLTKVDRKEMRRLIETARAKAPKGTSELR